MRALGTFLAVAVLGVAAPATAGTTVHVRGRILDGAGKPVQGARVSFELHPDRQVYNQRDCEVRPFEVQCRVHRVVGTTNKSGRYALPVKLSSYLASERRHELRVTDRATPGSLAPAQTAIYVYFTRKNTDVVDLRVWRARPSADPDGPLHRTVAVEPLAASYGRPWTTGPTVELVQGADVVWRYEDLTEDRRVDARTLEAGTTGIRAVAIGLAGALQVSYRTPTYPVTGGAQPASRNAACFTYGRDDAPVSLPGCRFTDGKLARAIDPAYQQAHGKACNIASECDHPRWVVVVLGAPRPVGAVAVRGCAAGAVEVSADGSFYAAYPTTDLGDGLLVGPPLLASSVRFDLADCVFTATELSIFTAL